MLQGDLSRFTKPNIQTVELVLLAGAQGEILPDLFFHRGPRWVKRVILSATDFLDAAVPAAAYTQWLDLITARWWIRMKEQSSGALFPIPMFDSQHWERVAAVVPGGGNVQFSLRWELDHPFTVYMNDVLNIDWANRGTVAAIIAAGQFNVAIHGHGASSGKVRSLMSPVPYLINPGLGLQSTGTAPVVQNAINQFGEDFIAERLLIWTTGGAGGLTVADSRYLQHLVARIYVSGKQTLSLCGTNQPDWVPLIAYGSHRNTDNCCAIWEPQGSPLLLDTSEGMGWQFTNGSALTQRIQVSLVSLLPE